MCEDASHSGRRALPSAHVHQNVLPFIASQEQNRTSHPAASLGRRNRKEAASDAAIGALAGAGCFAAASATMTAWGARRTSGDGQEPGETKQTEKIAH